MLGLTPVVHDAIRAGLDPLRRPRRLGSWYGKLRTRRPSLSRPRSLRQMARGYPILLDLVGSTPIVRLDRFAADV